jgi:hypothetical protein
MDTVRTRPSEQKRLLHLSVAPRNFVSAEQHILLLDLSGEDFDDAMESTDEAGRLVIIKGASVFCLLIDCSKLVDSSNRQSCLSRSKWDLVIASTDPENTKKFVKNAINRAKDQFEQKVSSLSFYKIASRPEHLNSLPLGFGLEELLSSWVNSQLPLQNAIAPVTGIYREFDRLASRPIRSKQL